MRQRGLKEVSLEEKEAKFLKAEVENFDEK